MLAMYNSIRGRIYLTCAAAMHAPCLCDQLSFLFRSKLVKGLSQLLSHSIEESRNAVPQFIPGVNKQKGNSENYNKLALIARGGTNRATPPDLQGMNE